MSMKSKAPLYVRNLSALAIAVSVSLTFLSLAPAVLAQSPKAPTADQIAETVIAFAGNGAGRLILDQIRRNGVERGRMTRTAPDGRAEEVR
jgi:hypothetical protein